MGSALLHPLGQGGGEALQGTRQLIGVELHVEDREAGGVRAGRLARPVELVLSLHQEAAAGAENLRAMRS